MSTPDPKSLGAPAGAPVGGAPAATPMELQLAEAQVPRLGETPTLPTAAAASTPGAALAGARFPGGPTVPDFDPMTLTRVVGQLANELFASPFAMGGGVPSSDTGAPVASSPPAPGGVPAGASTAPLHEPARGAATTGAPAEPTVATEAPAPAAAHAGVAPTAAIDPRAPGVGAPAAAPPGGGAWSFDGARSPFDAPLDLSGIDEGAVAASLGLAPHLDVGLLDRLPAAESVAEPPPHVATPVIPVDLFEVRPTVDPSIPKGVSAPFEPHVLKREFPILDEPVRGKRLVWLDNAATTQKPKTVIDRVSYFYEHENSNIHRAAHTLAARATDAYEAARESVRRFINAPSAREIVFVRGATEGLNLLAKSYGARNVHEGDEIVLTWLEHHANIVPWQQLAAATGARLRIAPVDDRGEILLDEYERLLGPKTKIVAFTQVSNALGTITPAKEMIAMAHRHGAVTVLDGAQAVSHMPVDVQALACDFFVFSGHKVFAPTGIGAVFGRAELLEAMPPWQGGGNMIQDVTFEKTVFQPAPARFEAGTGNIADAVGLGAALDWLTRVGLERVERYEHELLVYATGALATVPGLTMIGTAKEKAGVLSFILDGQKTEEVGGMLDQEGIAVRSGHHCAQPILRRFGLEATVRASLAPYNTTEDIDALVAALTRIQTGKTRRAR